MIKDKKRKGDTVCEGAKAIFNQGGLIPEGLKDSSGDNPNRPEYIIPSHILDKICPQADYEPVIIIINKRIATMDLDQIIRRAIPDDPKDCRVKKDMKDTLRLITKRDLLVFISKNFIPKPKEESKQG